jgi:hypothetical protein
VKAKSRTEDVNARVNRVLKALASVGRLRRHNLSAKEIAQVVEAIQQALERAQLTLQVIACKKKTVFSLREI